jgi:hypothetical protein
MDQHRLVTTTIRTRANVLPIFIMLQCLDFVTTLHFLAKGVPEGNPLLTMMAPYAHAQWIGLICAKLTATLIAFCCYRTGRIRVLQMANVGYFLIVGWNLATIAAASLAR